MPKACAVHEGRGYCRSCHRRLFQPVRCVGCGRTIRSYGGATPAHCRTCRTRGRRCLRCGKPVPHAALIVENGVACPSCARYFRAPQVCPECGLTSHHLARDYKNGFMEPVCERCRRKGHITCPACGKNRAPAGTDSSGRTVCRTCLKVDGMPFICPRCGREGRRHSADSCEACYWQAYARRKAESLAARIGQQWVQVAFLKFVEDLLARIDPQKAALRVEAHFSFFAILDGEFGTADLSEREMVVLFGTEGLRRHAVPYGFLQKEGLLREGGETRDAAERSKQEAVLEKAAGCWYEPVLREYLAHLWSVCQRYRDRGWTGKRRRFQPRTITGNLRAAARFLGALETSVCAVQRIDQVALDMYIARNPGGRNGIRAFVRYLNTKQKLFTKLRVETVPTSLPRDLLLRHERYVALLRTWLNPRDAEVKESLICVLMLLYVQPVKKVVRMKLADLSRGEDGLYRVMFGRAEIALDQRVGELLERYLPLRKALATMEEDWQNEFLFTGRGYGRHLSETGVTHYLRKHGVTAETLFATGLFYAYLAGLRHPKVLVRALGITDATAMKYFDIINPKLRDAVERRLKDG